VLGKKIGKADICEEGEVEKSSISPFWCGLGDDFAPWKSD